MRRTFIQSTVLALLFIMEHNATILENMKSITDKNCGKFQKAFVTKFEHNH